VRSAARWQKNGGKPRLYKTSSDGALNPPSAFIDRRYSRQPSDDRLPAVDWIQHLQWPAMAATLLSAWLVAAQSKKWRQWGFWFFLVSNVLWIGWGWHDHAYALVLLQIGLAILNIRGAAKND
jgi:hypothetical protein